MTRLCIFVVYDPEKQIDAYVGFLLRNLRSVSDRVITVCNFDKVSKGIEHLEGSEIYYRENLGYDAGAYKYAISELLTWDEIYKYDELLLTNDTYFGPLYSFEYIFDLMSKKNCDYWGMTRHPNGCMQDGYIFTSHIQSYMLIFKRNVLQSEIFRDFWRDLPNCKTIDLAIKYFEIGLYYTLQDAHFLGLSYIDDVYGELQLTYNENPYLKNSLELIRDYKLPLLKKKCINLNNKWFANGLGALSYIEKELGYDSTLIKEHIKRISKIPGADVRFDFDELELFVRKHKKCYIYGDGVWAHNIDEYFKYRGWRIPPHVVSEKKSKEEILTFDNMCLNEEDGIIIAVSKKESIREILQNILLRYRTDQVIYPR